MRIYLMDNAVAFASWCSICDAASADSVEVVDMDVAQPDVHYHLPWGRTGNGLGHQFQCAQRILPPESILYNCYIRHDPQRWSQFTRELNLSLPDPG